MGFPLDEHVKTAVVRALNYSLSSASYVDFFNKVGADHAKKFFSVVSMDWLPQLYDDGASVNYRLYMLRRVCAMTGLSLDPTVLKSAEERGFFGQPSVLEEIDVLALIERVKSLDLLSAAQAYVQRTRAQLKSSSGNNQTANRLMGKKREKKFFF